MHQICDLPAAAYNHYPSPQYRAGFGGPELWHKIKRRGRRGFSFVLLTIFFLQQGGEANAAGQAHSLPPQSLSATGYSSHRYVCVCARACVLICCRVYCNEAVCLDRFR